MTVYGLYIYDRHCNCCFYTSPQPSPSTSTTTTTGKDVPSYLERKEPGTTTFTKGVLPPLPPPLIMNTQQQSHQGEGNETVQQQQQQGRKSGGKLPFDEEAKLVYGVVFSLKNMVKKLSSRETDSFQSFSTSTYKLHSYSSPSSYHFILVTSPSASTSTISTTGSNGNGGNGGDTSYCRQILSQLYKGPFLQYVVRNPMVELDHYPSSSSSSEEDDSEDEEGDKMRNKEKKKVVVGKKGQEVRKGIAKNGIGNEGFRREVDRILLNSGI